MESDITKNNNLKLWKLPLDKILLGFTILYFIIFGVFMAYTNGQPDQGPHQYYSWRFYETWGIPEEEMDVAYRIVTGQPYLYYWLNGAIAKIWTFIFPKNPPIRIVMLWRLFSVFLSTITVYYCYKTASKLTKNPYAGILAAFFLSNTLMFVFVSGGNSYDNLMNLAAMAAIFHLLSVYKGENFIRHTALTGTWVIIGSLAKEQFLLLTLIIFLAWIYFAIRNLKKIQLIFSRTNILLLLVFTIFLGLFLGLYGVNLIRYSSTTPMCKQIKPPEKCGSFDYRWDYYEPFNPYLIWFQRDDIINPIRYAFEYWLFSIAESTWGILSHNTFIPMLSIGLHTLLMIWWFACLSRYWDAKNSAVNVLIFILLAYLGYIFVWNYKSDLTFSFQHWGVTGRYLSPVFGVLFVLMAYYFSKIRRVMLKRLTLSLSIMIYFSGGLWMYVSRYAEIFYHWRLFK